MIAELPNDIFDIIIKFVSNGSIKDILAARLVSKAFSKKLPKFIVNKMKIEKFMANINRTKAASAHLEPCRPCINEEKTVPHGAQVGTVYLYYSRTMSSAGYDELLAACATRWWKQRFTVGYHADSGISCIQRNFPYCRGCIKDYNLIDRSDADTSPKLIFSYKNGYYISPNL